MKKTKYMVLLTGIVLCFMSCEAKPGNSIVVKDTVPKLTVEMIHRLSGFELLQATYTYIAAKVSDKPADEYASFRSLTKQQQAIYTIWLLESEVNNGGFNQFYFNSSGKYAKLLTENLKLVGANSFAALMAKAHKTYTDKYKEISKKQDGTLDGFSKSYEDNPLNKYDDEFYALYKVENLEDLQIKFIKANSKEIIGNK